MIQHLTGGAWGVAIRRLARGGRAHHAGDGAAVRADRARRRPSLRWAQPEHVAHDPILQHKALYLNVPFFLARAALLLRGLDRSSRDLLTRWSLRQDDERRPASPRRRLRAPVARRVWCSSASPSRSRRSTGPCRSSRTGSRPSTASSSWAAAPRPPSRSSSRSRRADRSTPPLRGLVERRSAARPRQADARLRHAVGLLQLLAVPDHLVRQPARGDPLVPRAACAAAGSGWRCSSSASTSRCRSPCCSRGDLKRDPLALAGVALVLVLMRFIDLFWLVAPAWRARRTSASTWLDIAAVARESAASGSGCSSVSSRDARCSRCGDPDPTRWCNERVGSDTRSDSRRTRNATIRPDLGGRVGRRASSRSSLFVAWPPCGPS